jgi:hypothetical protein
MPTETFGEILDGADAFAADEWRSFAREVQFPRPDEFHFFERDPDTGLSSDVVSASYVESKLERRTDLPRLAEYRVQPPLPMREEPTQRTVRSERVTDCARCVRHGVHLVGGVRAAQGLRRGGVDAGRPVVVKDNALAGTSASTNTFLG